MSSAEYFLANNTLENSNNIFRKLRGPHKGFWEKVSFFKKNGLGNETPADITQLVLSHLILYLFLKWTLKSSLLPETAYFKASIIWDLIASNAFLFLAIALYFLLLYQKRQLAGIILTWSDLPKGKPLRAFILLIAVILTWSYSSYDFNYYYNQGHYAERLLLILLSMGVWWRPAMILPYLVLLTTIMGQFHYPFEISYARPIDNLLIQVIALFAVWFVFFTVNKNHKIDVFVFLVCCLIAGHYWYPMWGKLQINWVMHDNVYLFITNGYAHGWLAFLTPETIVSLSKFFEKFNGLLVTGTVFFEAGALFFLWRESTLKLFILSWISFHSLVFFMVGYFFWKWVLMEIGLWFFFFRKNSRMEIKIFQRFYFGLSIPLILLIASWFEPPGLAWHDTNLAYTYRFEAVLENNEKYTVSPRFFAPYDDIFIFGAFGYLSQQPYLVGPYGATKSLKVADDLLKAKTAEQVFAIEAEHPLKEKNTLAIGKYDHFIQTFFRNYNQEKNKKQQFSILQPPPTFWIFPRGPSFLLQKEMIKKIIVTQVTSFYDGDRLKNIRSRVVREIEI